VWPALLLHEGGTILAKGVAQGSKDPVASQAAAPDTKRDQAQNSHV